MRGTKTVLIAAPVHPVLTEGLEALGYSMRMVPDISQADADVLLKDCEGVITSTRLQLTQELLASHPSLRWIGRMGSGMEVIDVAAATELGIAVFASPEGNRNAVAEHALGMLLSLLKKIPGAVREVKQGIWLREENRGEELEGKTIGLIGFGNTGRAFAKLLQGFDVTILAYDPYNAAPDPDYIRRTSLAEIQESADVLSFHVPIRPETRYYFDTDFLAAFRKPLVLLNTSRGEVVRSEVVEDGLHSGRLKAAALDVWEGEPLPKMSDAEQQRLLRLAQRADVLITPHIAGYSVEALYKMSLTLLHKIEILLMGYQKKM